MAEPTDPAELAALQAYNDAFRKLVDLQEHLPDTDTEGAVDAWVLNVHSLWQVVRTNWAKAGINSRAWRGVETTLVETLPNIQEDSITIAFVEYNELVARARQSSIRLFPLPIPDAPARRQTPVLRAGSQASLSPFQTRQKSVAPPTTPRPPTPTKEKTPVPSQRSLPREQTPTSPTPKKAVSSSDSTWPIPVRQLASSKANSGASATKSSAGPSFLGLRETDSRREGSPWGAYNTSSSRRPGWVVFWSLFWPGNFVAVVFASQ
ncbi:hypothetical protein ARMGADRAFT_1091692 [Armillaria gallica]|uniref:Uncharacterized protein n=1 Tax=Armillaria gallica TaxID=47427 RepID=A0A2H3CNY7_ARMGA|nr:hypothetical protein ARMGADRAFT_1091692 [Armillaria gallica]